MKSKFFKILLAAFTIALVFTMFSCSDSGDLSDVNNPVIPVPSTNTSDTTETDSATTKTEESTMDTEEATIDTDSATTEAEAETSISETSAESDDFQSSETEFEEETLVDNGITVFENGETKLTIVLAKSASSVKTAAANSLKSEFSSKLGIKIDVRNEDYFKLLNGGSLDGAKIVIGALSGDVFSQEIENPLRDGDYVITVKDGTLYLIGGSDEAVGEAVSYFANTYLKASSETLSFEEGDVYEKQTAASFKDIKISGNGVWNYTIVYNDNAVTLKYALEIRSLIASVTGYTLNMSTDSAKAVDYEIIVGAANRKESLNLSKSYDRPNVYYDVKVVGEKLVCMGEGWYTLGKMTSELEAHFDGMTSGNLMGSVLSGDAMNDIDSTGMLTRAEGTDVRIFNCNVFGSAWDNELYPIFKNNEERAEVLADIILAYDPDVITFNELYLNYEIYNSLSKEIFQNYTMINSEYDVGYPFAGSVALEKGNPEQIFIKKSCNFTVVDSGWRYFTEGGEGNVVWYHGIHWAVLKTTENKKFIVSVGHYADSGATDVYAKEHQAAIAMAQASSGSSETLPTIAAGDFFSSATYGAAYKHHVNTCRFTDPQRIESINRNIGSNGEANISQATWHDIGKDVGDGTTIDFILHNNLFTPLKFKVLRSNELNYATDHYPICVDLKFN